MYKKIANLNKIVSMGLNVHTFYIPTSYEEYCGILNEFKCCGIRTDHDVFTEDLPFYIFNDQKDGTDKLNAIWQEAQDKNLKLIISNGMKYDPVQEYNMVAKLQANGDFIFEASELKIPLRHMYRHPLLSCSGNIADEVSQWEIYNARYGINKIDIRNDLLLLYEYQIFDRWLEITKYPIPVGIKNEYIVFWQII